MKNIVWFCILSMLKKDSEMYGYEIAVILKDKIDIKRVNVYSNLRKMEDSGLVVKQSVLADNGHLRVYYAITKSGKILHQELLNTWEKQKNFLESIL